MSKKRNKDICVIGAGRFGQAVINQLSKMDCSLLIVDSNEQRLSEYKDVAHKIVIADAANTKTLKALNIKEMDTVVVAVSDNIDIVAALLEMDINNIIVRARSRRHARVLKQIGVNVIIQPEYEAGLRTALIAANPNFMRFSQNLQEVGDGFVIGTTSLNNAKYEGKTIKEVKFYDYGVSVVLIKRGAKSILPGGLTTLEKGDIMTLIGKVQDVTNALGELNK
ncbi:potassium channel family protein [Mycoplasma tauri]|uniref:TrkA family potassium uptake protein n=1 Tax=Mycoplasma tauri TaxID=547987 RepID=A0A953T7F0_9MOLU|nr:TrkA family potassium uptake protein [Mycoplasma tauri]MBZ4195602.1 TrkA family potassium uptake protein [Mycoplasma tauri]MBZ4203832.1 TrkA family potassium uptake protein [Mycoplasma tauri]MBZ4204277.1 TrkA family potassium uptake protein [Mycoplasma tauri]MBZ4212538.1 TrkA family potassium uptake protein [Mycoplasma tauri]MBZ4218525.1 TrkA family potassium uptake protein [Mycoplasma tauri]